MNRLLLLLFTLLPALSYAQGSDINQVVNGLNPSPVHAIGKTYETQHILNRMKATWVNGLSVAVVENGKIAWAKGYGLKDASNKSDSVTANTLFQCASIGKIITALSAMKLVKENKIELDEDVNLKLKTWKIPENNFTRQKKVSLRMLLSHSSGLDDNYGFQGYYPGVELPSLLQMLNATSPANNKKQLVIKRVPGSVENYSGGGYLIVQQLIEDLSGTTFEAYVKENILLPLEMHQTTYNHYPDTELQMDIARGHEDNGKIDPKRKYNLYPEMAAAGPWTTPTDLAKLIIAIHEAKTGKSTALLDSSMISQMLSPQLNAMGLGLNLKGADQVLGYWHAGNNAGYTGMLFGISDSGQGAVVLSNSNAGEYLALEIIRSIANTYRWPIMTTLVESPVKNIGSYPGLYKVREKPALIFSNEGEQLYFNKIGSKTKYKLYHTLDGSFRMLEKPDNLKFIFQKDSTGKITGATMFENAGSINIMTK